MSTRIDRLGNEAREVAHDVEELLEATRDSTSEQLQRARDRATKSLRAVNQCLQTTAAAAGERVQYAAARARKGVEEHPWSAVGIAALVGVALGLLLRRK